MSGHWNPWSWAAGALLCCLCSSAFAKTRTYRITLVKARISPTKPNQMNWDSGFGKTRLPDVYVVLKLGKKSFRSKVIRNTLKPAWKQSWVVTVDSKKVTPFVILKDKDLQLDDDIGRGELNWKPVQRTFLGQAEMLEIHITPVAGSKKKLRQVRIPSSRPVKRRSHMKRRSHTTTRPIQKNTPSKSSQRSGK